MPNKRTAIPKLKTNLDTDFLKLIAVVSMLIDHIGSAFFRSIRSFAGLAVWLSLFSPIA